MKVLIPEYLENFQCIGSACEDTCCIGWNVIIDEKTNSKYKKVLGSDYKKFIKRYRSGNKEYLIKMDENGACPLLTDDKLCSIHANYGPSYLSNTCKFYPRITNTLFDSYEQSATMSCPEIARLALKNKDGIEFKEIDMDLSDLNISGNLKQNTKSSLFLKTFWDIRIFCIQILKTREYSLEERLITIGLFLNGIEKFKNETDIKERISNFNKEFDNFNMMNSIKNLPSDKKLLQINSLNLIISGKSYGVGSSEFIDIIDNMLKNYNLDLESVQNSISDDFLPSYNTFIEKYNNIFNKNYDYILENYLINELFKDLFPNTRYGDPLHSYMNLVTKFTLIRTILIGLNISTPLTEDKILKVIQKFSKSISHDDPFQRAINEFILGLNYNPIAFSMGMLKI